MLKKVLKGMAKPTSALTPQQQAPYSMSDFSSLPRPPSSPGAAYSEIEMRGGTKNAVLSSNSVRNIK